MSIYMCGHLGIGDTRFNDVPFVPSQDCLHWESCQEEAYRKGREDQGELNTDTVREIHDLVFQQGIEKGRADALDEVHKLICDYLYGNNIHLIKIAKYEADTQIYPYKMADDIYKQLKEKK